MELNQIFNEEIKSYDLKSIYWTFLDQFYNRILKHWILLIIFDFIPHKYIEVSVNVNQPGSLENIKFFKNRSDLSIC